MCLAFVLSIPERVHGDAPLHPDCEGETTVSTLCAAASCLAFPPASLQTSQHVPLGSKSKDRSKHRGHDLNRSYSKASTGSQRPYHHSCEFLIMITTN